MEWDLTYKVTGYMIQCVYYAWGPYKWDPIGRRVVDAETIWENLRWGFVIAVMTVVRLFLIIQTLYSLAMHEIQLREITDVLPLIMGIICSWSLMLEWHTLYRRREVRILVNAELSHFEQYINKHQRHDTKCRRNWTAIFLAFFLGSLIFLATGMAVAYLLNCKLHSLAPSIPICSEDDILLFGVFQTHHYNFSLVLLMAVVEFLFVLQNVSVTFIYLLMGVPLGLTGINIFQELRYASQESNGKLGILKRYREWTHNYRCFQIFANIADKCLFDFVIPFIIGATMFLHILILFGLIAVHLEMIVAVSAITYEGVLFAVYFCIFDRVGMFQDISKNIQDSWKAKCVGKYFVTHLRSLAPVRFKVGTLFYLQKHTIITVCGVILGKIVELLLLNPI